MATSITCSSHSTNGRCISGAHASQDKHACFCPHYVGIILSSFLLRDYIVCTSLAPESEARPQLLAAVLVLIRFRNFHIMSVRMGLLRVRFLFTHFPFSMGDSLSQSVSSGHSSIWTPIHFRDRDPVRFYHHGQVQLFKGMLWWEHKNLSKRGCQNGCWHQTSLNLLNCPPLHPGGVMVTL